MKVLPLELPSLFLLARCEPATHHMRVRAHTVSFPGHEHINSLVWVECLFNKSYVLGFFKVEFQVNKFAKEKIMNSGFCQAKRERKVRHLQKWSTALGAACSMDLVWPRPLPTPHPRPRALPPGPGTPSLPELLSGSVSSLVHH